MADYLAMKSYVEKNNLLYLLSIFGKPIKAVIHHLPPDTPAEDISNSREDLNINVINVRQMTVTRTALNGQIHVDPPSPKYFSRDTRIEAE
jgi:hypothetical protein